MSEDEAPVAAHPDDHEAFWLFLRQERREEDVIVDIFYCAQCLGRVEVEATGAAIIPGERPRQRGLLPRLGSSARTT